MDLISDILLIGAAFGLAAYCIALSRRLRALSETGNGLGATIETLSERVDTLTQTAAKGVSDAEAAAKRLATLIEEAKRCEGELAFLLAGIGDDEPTPVVPEERPATAGLQFSSRMADVAR